MIKLFQKLVLFLPVLIAIFLTLPASSAQPQARRMFPTTYDDGKRQPGNCDAHVVFHPSVNGTRNAFDPASTRESPRKCVKDQFCRICFSEQADSCMLARYRGVDQMWIGLISRQPSMKRTVLSLNYHKRFLPSAAVQKLRFQILEPRSIVSSNPRTRSAKR